VYPVSPINAGSSKHPLIPLVRTCTQHYAGSQICPDSQSNIDTRIITVCTHTHTRITHTLIHSLSLSHTQLYTHAHPQSSTGGYQRTIHVDCQRETGSVSRHRPISVPGVVVEEIVLCSSKCRVSGVIKLLAACESTPYTHRYTHTHTHTHTHIPCTPVQESSLECRDLPWAAMRRQKSSSGSSRRYLDATHIHIHTHTPHSCSRLLPHTPYTTLHYTHPTYFPSDLCNPLHTHQTLAFTTPTLPRPNSLSLYITRAKDIIGFGLARGLERRSQKTLTFSNDPASGAV
jgi:hypothetical protein